MEFIFTTNDRNPDPICPDRLLQAIAKHLALKDVHSIYDCKLTITDRTYISLFDDDSLLYHSHPDMYHTEYTGADQ